MVEDVLKNPADNTTKIYANNLVRVSADTQKIDKFFPTLNKPKITIETGSNLENIDIDVDKNVRNIDIDKNVGNIDIDKKLGNFDVDKNNADIGDNENNINQNTSQNSVLDDSLLRDDEKKSIEKWDCHINPADTNTSYIDPKESFKTRKFQYERIETKLTSVKQLRLDIENRCSANLREILANLIFIGCIDVFRSLIQHSTKLYLCDTTKLT